MPIIFMIKQIGLLVLALFEVEPYNVIVLDGEDNNIVGVMAENATYEKSK
jgi:hypothetical protein